MATLIINNKIFDIKDNSPLLETCEQGGVPFSCQSGNCGTCQIEIIEGHDHLSPLTKQEMDMAMDRYNRLACQCRIIHQTVSISF